MLPQAIPDMGVAQVVIIFEEMLMISIQELYKLTHTIDCTPTQTHTQTKNNVTIPSDKL